MSPGSRILCELMATTFAFMTLTPQNCPAQLCKTSLAGWSRWRASLVSDPFHHHYHVDNILSQKSWLSIPSVCKGLAQTITCPQPCSRQGRAAIQCHKTDLSSTNSTIILKQILPFPNKCHGNAYKSSTRHVLLSWIWRKRRRSPLASLLEHTRHWENPLPHLLVLLGGFFRHTTCVRSFVTNLILDFGMWVYTRLLNLGWLTLFVELVEASLLETAWAAAELRVSLSRRDL